MLQSQSLERRGGAQGLDCKASPPNPLTCPLPGWEGPWAEEEQRYKATEA